MNTHLKKITDIYPDFFQRLIRNKNPKEEILDFSDLDSSFWKNDGPITHHLADQLIRQGIDPNGLTRNQASLFLEYLKRPSWKQSATRAQQYALRQIGEFSEEEIRRMNKKRASKYIDKAVKSGRYKTKGF